MRFLPLVVAILGLMALVVLMAGPGEARTRSLRNMGLTIIALIGMALLFGLVARSWIGR